MARPANPGEGCSPPKEDTGDAPLRYLTSLISGLIEWSSTGNPRKLFTQRRNLGGKRLQDIWNFKDGPYPDYPTEKNLDLLKTIIDASSKPGDTVLDCFCGSGTTLLAAHQLGRHWIGIDQSAVALCIL